MDETIKSDPRVHDVSTADDELFVSLAQSFANAHLSMKTGRGCGKGDVIYPNGIIRGLKWKPQAKTLSTYAYSVLNSLQLSLHLSCCHFPIESELKDAWQASKESLIRFAEEGMTYVHGFIISGKGKPLKLASVTFENRKMYANASLKGEFFKYLPPGEYTLAAQNPHYENSAKTVTTKSKTPVHLQFVLHTNLNFHIHSYDEMVKTLKSRVSEYPSITRLYSIGKSVAGRELWVLEISDNPGVHEAGEPEFRYVAGIYYATHISLKV